MIYMNRLKTSKSIKKRLKVTSTGKLLRHKAYRSHLLQKKTSKRKQGLRRKIQVNQKDLSNFKKQILYII